MAVSDPIADMLTCIRNAGNAKHDTVDIPGSKFKIAIMKIFKKEGYIRDYKFTKDNKQGVLCVSLKKSKLGVGCIVDLKRVSKPGRRVYLKAREVKSVYNGTGIAILSTSFGVITDKHARKRNIGGEILCTVW